MPTLTAASPQPSQTRAPVVASAAGPGAAAANAPKILLLIDGMAALTDGGTERQLLQMVRVARAAGLRPSVCVLRDTRWLTSELAGCPVRHASFYSLRSLAGWRELYRLARWMRQQRFALLQTFFTDANLLGPVIGRCVGVGTIFGTRRSLNPAPLPGLRALALRLLGRLSNRLATRILTNAEAVSRNVAATERLPAAKLVVAYNGVEVLVGKRPRADRAKVRNLLHVAEDELLVGNVSGLRAVKALDIFLRAAALAGAQAPRLRFVLVGEGPERGKLEGLIEELALGGVVTLAGAQQDVQPYLAAIDVAVLCSEAEGFSNSILEYMAAGLPVVATDVGGNREALGEAGVLIPARDEQALAGALLALRPADRRAELSALAAERAQLFSVEAAERRMRAIYREHCPALRSDRRMAQEAADGVDPGSAPGSMSSGKQNGS